MHQILHLESCPKPLTVDMRKPRFCVTRATYFLPRPVQKLKTSRRKSTSRDESLRITDAQLPVFEWASANVTETATKKRPFKTCALKQLEGDTAAANRNAASLQHPVPLALNSLKPSEQKTLTHP